ncbi:hypothetical protein DMENIID0001_007030 [Sergentomyia squamirostris]
MCTCCVDEAEGFFSTPQKEFIPFLHPAENKMMYNQEKKWAQNAKYSKWERLLMLAEDYSISHLCRKMKEYPWLRDEEGNCSKRLLFYTGN